MPFTEKEIKKQLLDRGIHDGRVLAVMQELPREEFAPPELAHFAYRDGVLPIGDGQTLSQPFIVAFMSQEAGILPTDRVLEIGTGSGYQTAVLAKLAAEVVSVEVRASMSFKASRVLRSMGLTNAHLLVGDGYAGWSKGGPYDVIIVTAAAPSIPPALLDQLAYGGRMILPLGTDKQTLWRVTRKGQVYEQEALLPVKFVPLVPGESIVPTPDPTP
ncbi:MAG TPA: protein-L-isoaspartate(D-aspartate) O-methyltransferase [Bdellovibrionota bacterium]|nr:protein-L-isoaspartate(D-aspartate) O-methyltransferase [Bdellovibrionota bacterium]